MNKREIEAIYPLSPMQQGMLFHTLYAPQSGEYCQQISFTLHGDLDVPAFQRAWQRVVERQPVLRTLFVWEGRDEPLQVVRRQASPSWIEGDWRGRSPGERMEQLESFLEAEVERGFDLSQAPLMRLALFRLSENSYQFVWTYHHLLFDGWSLPILFREVLSFYKAFRHNQDIPLERSRPYRDYIAWLQQQDVSKAESFWRQALAGFTMPTPLRVDRPLASSSAQEPSYSEQQILIPATVTQALQSIAQQHRLTLNTLVIGAWAILLSRYSGEQDVVFGATVSGRPAALPGVESTVGLFINTLPVRVPVSPKEPLLTWLGRCLDHQVQARQYEYSPLVQVQRWSEVPRSLPLFESILVFENYPISTAAKENDIGFEIQEVRSIERTNYPLTVAVSPGAELALAIAYDQRRFESDTITRMLGHVQTLLENMVANPTQQLGSISLLTETERQQLLVEWNDVPSSSHPHSTIHALFEAQVEQTPDAVAVAFQDQLLTFRELNGRANQLAHYLRSLGAGSETIVGICMERSVEMIVAILGTFKASGAYLPLNPAYPVERLSFMLQDSQARVLLSQSHLLKTLSLLSRPGSPPAVCLDQDGQAIAGQCRTNPVNTITPQNLAYAIYTSGSTGRPKGVLIPHQALVNHSLAVAGRYHLRSDDQVLQFASMSFDVALEELFPSWLCGARVVLCPEQATNSLRDFVHFVEAERLTVLNLPTPYWQEWVSELSSPEIPFPSALRLVVIGSEKALPESLATWQRQVSHQVQWCNAYGPTEATITTTIYEPAESSPVVPGQFSVPIGRPIANAQVYVLDGQLNPAPIGVPGELYIGGGGLARGYLNHPDLTAESFIPNPFTFLDRPSQVKGDTENTRLYKTGDLARWLPDGNLDFLGRADHQVKVRGFRIELGEIEAILNQHPAVREAVVSAREDTPGDTRLVAYIVGSAQQPGDSFPTAHDLRIFLKENLPEYMAPSAFVFLAEGLPLMPNGKVDRRALPAPDTSRPTTGEAYAAPRTPIEEMLAGIWAQVLGVERVGIHDDFFELGGHSLLATLLVSRLRDAFQVELPLRHLFEVPTVAGLAETILDFRSGLALAGQSPGSQKQPLKISTAPPVQPVPGDRNRLQLSYAQQRLWFLQQLEPDSPAYNIPLALRLIGSLDVTAFEQSLAEIIRRHEALRTTFATVEGHPIQAIQPIVNFRLLICDLAAWGTGQEAEIQRLCKAEFHRPFDLSRDLPVRVILFRLSAQEHIFLLTMHHIVSDGWSVEIFFRELTALYQAFCTGQAPPLGELPIQYADFAHWQRQWLQGDVLEAQLSYWKQQLEQVPLALDLPTDHPRPVIQTFRGATQAIVFPVPLSQALKALSRSQGVTLFMLLLAGFQTLLYRYTNQKDIPVGSPIANRNRTEVEGLIGFFVNTLVLRTRLVGALSFRELLRRVREVTLEAYAHQDLPFEKLVEELDPKRDLSRSPLFQVMFIFLNVPEQPVKLEGLTLTSLESDFQTAKFDLTLHMTDTDQGLFAQLEYNTDLFDGSTALRMLGHFQTLLEGIVADPNQRLANLPLLTDAEQHQLLIEWNDTQTEYPRERGIPELFEAQVEQTPDNVAIVYQDQHLTYQELNRRANQLAHHLQSLGVRPDTLVGICMERSVEMVMGLLGVLKASGAYVPLDPHYPQERLIYMLQDARLPVLLTHSDQADVSDRLRASLPECGASITTLSLDSDWEAIADQCAANPACRAAADHLAYVIYTSGSTGKPKGVPISHSAVVNFICGMRQQLGLTNQDRFLAVTTLSFDIAGLELYLPLVTGTQIVMNSREVASDGQQLSALLSCSQAAAMQATPVTWRLLLDAGWPGHAHFKILCGGEALPRELANQLLNKCVALWNLYGPTETTIWSTTCRLESKGEMVSIGRPIANTHIYVLDDSLQPVPIGVPGELYIGGVGLSQGYVNRPELTADKFIPNPFLPPQTKGKIGGGGARLYKTGDLTRYLPDGRLEFLGRIDHQVKVRGFRIELGEIEAVLEQHPAVQQAAATVRNDSPNEQRLVAYVVPNLQYHGPEEKAIEAKSKIEQVSQWQTVWNETYHQTAPNPDPTFNTIGWNSSYTGAPIPEQEMREWVSNAVERILALKPRRVLEIGCGTGLLLFQIAQHCAEYWGTDFSQAALSYIGEQLAQHHLPHVKLFQRTADDLEGIEAGSFDVVILNSVAQYLPNLEYLKRTLAEMARVTAPGGFIFVGDVRSLALLQVFHLSVQLHRASPSLPTAELHQRAKNDASQERELVIAPAFFYSLPRYIPEISHVQVQLKRGRHHNELVRFRYDVILRVAGVTRTAPEPQWVDWQEQKLTVSTLRQLLINTKPESLGIARVPNARLLKDVQTLQMLASDPRPKTISDLQKALQGISWDAGVDPEDIWALSDELPYSISITWADSAHDCYDLVLLRRSAEEQDAKEFPALARETNAPWHSLANNPLQTRLTQDLAPMLRSFVKTKLPEYMIPSAFVLLDALPLTPNGKVDRRMLPAPDRARPQTEKAFAAPRTPVEETLAGIWSEVLRFERIGIHDNFFELGGHSLLATQVMARVREAFQIELPLRSLFESPTVAGLAEIIMNKEFAQVDQETLARLLADLDQLSADEIEAMLGAV